MEEFKMEKLRGAVNWCSWKFQMRIILKSMDLFKIVDGTYIKPVNVGEGGDASNALYMQNLQTWEKCDIKAQRMIITSVDNVILKYLMCCKEACEMWRKLHSVHEMQTEVSIHLLQQQFYDLKKNADDSIEMHIAKIEELGERLKNLGEPLTDNMIITKILMTLPPAYNHFVTAWESTEENKRNISNLTNRLILEQTRLSRDTETAEAFMTKKHSQNEFKKKPGKCFKCNKEGHWKKDCPLLKKKDYKPNNYSKSNAFMGRRNNSYNINDIWLIDSGATEHMTFHREWFTNYHQFEEPSKIKIGDGTTLNAVGEGNIDILIYNNNGWTQKYLENVLLVPDMKVNLFSATAAMDKGYVMESNKYQCTFTRDNKVEAIGERRGNLFELKLKVITKNQHNYMASSNNTLKMWHQRFVHQNIKHVTDVLKARNMNYKDDEFKVCEGCCLGKQHKLPYFSSENRSEGPGEIIHADICGPMEELSVGKSKYFLLLKDDFSRFKWVYFLQQKSEVFENVKNFLSRMRNKNINIGVLRSDNGTEFINNSMNQLLKDFGIQHQKSVNYTPEQNGAAEREMRTIVELARSSLQTKSLSKCLWAETVHHVVYVLNRTGTSSIKNKTPFEIWFNKIPKIDHLKVFGAQVFAHTPKQTRKKWDAKSKKGIFVGFDLNVKGYRIFFENVNKIEVFRDVIFCDELEKPVSNTQNDSYSICNFKLSEENQNENNICDNEEVIQISEENQNENNICDNEEVIQIAEDSEQEVQSFESASNGQVEGCSQDVVSVQSQSDSSSVQVIEPEHENISTGRSERYGYNLRPNPVRRINFDEMFLSVMENDLEEPCTYEDAIKSRFSSKWKAAMDEEYNALMKNNTWKLCKLPEGRKLVDCRWIYKIKYKGDNTVERYKARLVARGFTQEHGLDYEETFSPVVKYDSIRLMLAVAISEGMSIKQFDIKTAFLYGDLTEEIYMSQPPGYVKDSQKVCLLKKSLYGLKQAPRCFNKKFCEILDKFNMKMSKSDSCVFIKNIKGLKIILAIYVDDGLLIYNNEKLANDLLKHLGDNFEIKLCEVNKFLGFQIKIKSSESIFLHQQQYMEKILKRFFMENCNPVSTPLEPGWINRADDGEPNQQFPYKEVIGSLIYLSIISRPDISYAVCVLSRYMEKPCQAHVNAAKRVLRYIKGTVNHGLLYTKKNGFEMKTYSDSDYAGDIENRRSTSGVITMLGECSVTWRSQQQRTVALSTTEAEYIAGCDAVKDIVWTKRFLQ